MNPFIFWKWIRVITDEILKDLMQSNTFLLQLATVIADEFIYSKGEMNIINSLNSVALEGFIYNKDELKYAGSLALWISPDIIMLG